MVEPSWWSRTSRLLVALGVGSWTWSMAGCSYVPKARLDDCHRLSQDGNHVLAFVGYNAGRGRVKEWTTRYGDPRSPNVDAVDWVERIPFTETRIYVQRVMENLQVYRSRFDEPARLTIEADMRGAEG